MKSLLQTRPKTNTVRTISKRLNRSGEVSQVPPLRSRFIMGVLAARMEGSKTERLVGLVQAQAGLDGLDPVGPLGNPRPAQRFLGRRLGFLEPARLGIRGRQRIQAIRLGIAGRLTELGRQVDRDKTIANPGI